MKLIFAAISSLLLLCCDEAAHKTTDPFTNETACLFSQISYCNNTQQQLAKYLPGWKIVWDAAELNGNHAFVAKNDNKYVLTIRGSLMEFSWNAFENWIYQDLNVASQEKWIYSDPSKDARISTGAYRGWQNISTIKDKQSGKDLLSFLLRSTGKKDSIFITGHSLGGNLAIVTASWLASKFKESGRSPGLINVITFAAPAAGNEEFASTYNKTFPKSCRVENSGDIVPKFPCPTAVASLADLYSSSPSASEITVGYKNMQVPLSAVFKGTGLILSAFELQNGFSRFKQTCENPMMITVKPSGSNAKNDIASWLAEARYQHGIAQYAAALGTPVVDCR